MAPVKPPTPAQELIHRLDGCLRATETAGDSSPSLFDEATAICVDLLLEVAKLRAARNLRQENKVRGNQMEREADASPRATLEDTPDPDAL